MDPFSSVTQFTKSVPWPQVNQHLTEAHVVPTNFPQFLQLFLSLMTNERVNTIYHYLTLSASPKIDRYKRSND